MFRQVFDPDNLFWRIISKGVDIVGLSLLWVVLCLPVVTAGPAAAALYYTVVKTFRQGETGTFGVYFRSFKGCLKKGVLATLICIPLMALIVYGYVVMYSGAGSAPGKVLFMAYYVVLVLPVGMMCYLFPVLGRFELGLKELFRTSFLLTIRHLPSTVVVVLLTVESAVFMLERWWPMLFMPVFAALLTSFFFERIFPKYLTVEETAVLTDRTVEELEEERRKETEKKARKKR